MINKLLFFSFLGPGCLLPVCGASILLVPPPGHGQSWVRNFPLFPRVAVNRVKPVVTSSIISFEKNTSGPQGSSTVFRQSEPSMGAGAPGVCSAASRQCDEQGGPSGAGWCKWDPQVLCPGCRGAAPRKGAKR